jgi:lysophospholipase L1-like esterase
MRIPFRKTGARVPRAGYTVILLLSVLTVSPAYSTSTRIMLLGDSITAGFNGSNPVGGFRDDLDNLLINAGGEHDFVGTQNDGIGFDADHEGHGGWTVNRMLADIDSFLTETDPEMVLIHLGTNDISANEGVETTISEMDSLLEHIYMHDMTTIIHLSGIIPRNDPAGPQKDSLTTELNSGYLSMVNSWQSRGFPIKYVDHNGAFRVNPNWRNELLDDHVHPTNAGYAVMAQTYFDSLANENIFDNISPAMITDLAVESVTSRTALVSWTATGDDGNVGTADWYDLRYSTLPITGLNFGNAIQAVGEPNPLPSGSAEEYMVGGLSPSETYYFALKAMDEAGNPSPLSNAPSGQTVANHALLDDFERTELGSFWNADPEFTISNGELANGSLEERWDFIAAFNRMKDGEAVSLRWGTNADNMGIGDGGLALMMNSPSPDADGYLIFRHRVNNYYALWTITDGAPLISVAQSPTASLPFPEAGDIFEVVGSSDSHGQHFDCFINGEYDTRVSDPYFFQGNGSELWAGVMLHGNRNNNVEDFWVRGANVNLPPGSFNLVSPANGSTVETGVPLLDWDDSIDPNLSDTVFYTLYYGTSAAFAPESTTVVSGITESEYTIQPIEIYSLLKRSDCPARSAISPEYENTGYGKENPSPSSLPDDVEIFWKVKAVDSGDLETWSLQEDWSFMVAIPEPPLAFNLLSPTIGDTVETQTPLLIWESTSDPDPGDEITYTIYYDTEDGFPDPIMIEEVTDTSFITPLLDDRTLYYWKVEAVDGRGLATRSIYVHYFFVLTPTGIGDDGDKRSLNIPRVFSMGQNYPNPFNPSTSIRYDVPAAEPPESEVSVLLQVYNLRGQLIKTLEDGVKAPGSYVVHWDGRDEMGESAVSGIYLYRIQAGSYRATRKMVILK